MYRLVLPLLVAGCGGAQERSRERGPSTVDSAEPVVECGEGEQREGEDCISVACGTAPWGDEPLMEADLFVDASAATGGDGNADHPFRSIGEAITLAGESGIALTGGRIRVAGGQYPEALHLDEKLDGGMILGRCAELVTVDASAAGEDEVTLLLNGRQSTTTTLRGLTLTGGPYGGVAVDRGALFIEDTVINANMWVGAYVNGSTAALYLDTVEISSTLVNEAGKYGWGIIVADGGTLESFDLQVIGNREAGIFADGPNSSLDLSRTLVSDTLLSERGERGDGIHIDSGAYLVLREGELSRNHEFGLYVGGEGSVANVIDLRIEDTAPEESGLTGYGILVEDGAVLQGRALLLSRNTDLGLAVLGEGTRAVLTDLVVEDTRVAGDGLGGYGIEVAGEGTYVELNNARLSGNSGFGAYVSGEGTEILTNGLVIEGTLARDGDQYGWAATINDGATGSFFDCTMIENHTITLEVEGEGTSVSLNGCELSSTITTVEGQGGYGIELSGKARLDVVDTWLFDHINSALVVSGSETSFTWTGGGIVGTQVFATEVGEPYANVVNGQATGIFIGATFSENRGTSLGVEGEGSTVELVDSFLEDSLPVEGGSSGWGLLVQDQGSVTMRGGAITGHVIAVRVGEEGSSGTFDGVELGSGRTNDDDFGYTAAVSEDAVATFTDCDFVDVVSGALLIGGSETEVTVNGGSITRMRAAPDGGCGSAVEVSDAALLEMNGTWFEDTCGGVIATGEGTELWLSDVSLSRVRGDALHEATMAIGAQLGAELVATDLQIQDAEGAGIVLVAGGSMDCTRCSIERSRFAGVGVFGGSLSLTDSTIGTTLSDTALGGGVGVYVDSTEGLSDVLLRRVEVGEAPYAALWIAGDGLVEVFDSKLRGGTGVEVREGLIEHGNAVYAQDQTTAWSALSGLLLERVELHDSVGPAVLLDNSTASLRDVEWNGNTSDLVQQRCLDNLVTPSSTEGALISLCPAYDLPVATLVFNIQFDESRPTEE